MFDFSSAKCCKESDLSWACTFLQVHFHARRFYMLRYTPFVQTNMKYRGIMSHKKGSMKLCQGRLLLLKQK